mmetsp:Transcript_9865/g.19711  ORF Transcript_9865/g.19711 Transcript_9865/m.19711 type:complete len:318 (+) Transcript_9865:1372-2325(+)
MMAWKKEIMNTIDRSSPGFEHSKNSSLNGAMALRRFGFRPSGGSLVSLMHTCRILMGSAAGSAERKRRKLSCATERSSHRFSSHEPVHLGVRWMFCKKPQPPFLYAVSTIFSATGSCPCPSDTSPRFPASYEIPYSLPISSVSLTGSTPGERMKKMGVSGAQSGKERLRLNGSDVTYSSPISFLTNVASASPMRSVRRHRMMSSFGNSGSFFQSPGNPSSSGRSFSYQSRNRFCDDTISSPRGSKLVGSVISFSAEMPAHADSSSHSARGLVTPMALGPRMRNSNITGSSSPLRASTRKHSCVAKISLCFSNSPCAT